jgi:hypothetical protein
LGKPEENVESARFSHRGWTENWDGGELDVIAWQPGFPHLAVSLVLLTTKVVDTKASLLMMVWAGAVGGAINASTTKVSPVVVSNKCENLITPSS